MSSSSLFNSLGAVLHSLSSFKSIHHSNYPSSSIAKQPANAVISTFESDLAAHLLRLSNKWSLHLLHQAGASAPWPWLCKELIQLVLSTHSKAQEFLPELQTAVSHGDTKWLNHYLDDSIKLLDILNAMKASLSQLQTLISHADLCIRALSKPYLSRSQLIRARVELRHCARILRSHRSGISDSNYRSVLKKLSDRLNSIDEGRKFGTTTAASGGSSSFLAVSYAARLMVFFSCAVLSSVILSKSPGNAPIIALPAVHGPHVWVSPLTFLQRKLKDRVARTKHGRPLLDELRQSELDVKALKDNIEGLLVHEKISFPLPASHCAALNEIRDGFWVSTQQLKDGVASLLQNVEAMCDVLVRSRIVLLNLCINAS